MKAKRPKELTFFPSKMNRNDCYFRSRVCYMSLPVRMKSIVIAVCTKLYRLTLHAICELCRERERETCLW